MRKCVKILYFPIWDESRIEKGQNRKASKHSHQILRKKFNEIQKMFDNVKVELPQRELSKKFAKILYFFYGVKFIWSSTKTVCICLLIKFHEAISMKCKTFLTLLKLNFLGESFRDNLSKFSIFLYRIKFIRVSRPPALSAGGLFKDFLIPKMLEKYQKCFKNKKISIFWSKIENLSLRFLMIPISQH